jgi:L-aspartate oxidase
MVHSFDFLVIGSGIAGLMYALEVAEHGKVCVLSKELPAEGSTLYAQGGVASVTSPLDSFSAHINDTIEAGAGLCDREIVELVVEDGPKRIEQLVKLGTKFDLSNLGKDYELAQEGGHSARRILHARDATGAEMHAAVFSQVVKHPNIQLLPHHIAIEFILSPKCELGKQREVYGAYTLDLETNAIKTILAKVTMLATGGAGKAYLYTSNPDVATGDGIAMAYRAGAEIANMEFIQFHPTCLYHPEAKSFLITEAMRGEGAILTTIEGHRFMPEYDSRAELAPRDIVARAIDEQMKKLGHDHVLLDISHRDDAFIEDRFPNIVQRTKQLGFDICNRPIPVVPAAHYCCGGLLTNKHGKTSLGRLYAAGETACTGLHGANRLASNSLLEALVFAHRAARHGIAHLEYCETPRGVKEWDSLDTVQSPEEVLVSHIWDEVRRLMWNLVGIVRSNKRLDLAKRRLERIHDDVREYYWSYQVTRDVIELRNITTVATLIVNCAQKRNESRGLHYNVDCDNYEKNDLAENTVITRVQLDTGPRLE